MKKSTYTVAIVDDHLDELYVIREYIRRLPFLNLILETSDMESTLPQLENLRPDLLLLDVEMPRFSGFQLLEMLSYRTAAVICSGYGNYAYEASRAEVAGYISKVEAFDQFERVIRRAIRQWDARHVDQQGTDVIRVPASQGRNSKVNIPVGEIIRIEILEKETHFVCRDFVRVGRITLDALEQLLPVEQFVRVHRSHIINLGRVSGYNHSRLVMEGSDVVVPIGRNYAVALIDRLENK